MAKKSKFIVDKERIKYIEQLAELSQKVNPKMSRAAREQLKKERLENRDLIKK